MKVLSVAKILEKARGAVKLQDLLYRCGQPFPSEQAIHNWKARGVVPGHWAGAVIWSLACEGINPLLLIDDASPTQANDAFEVVNEHNGTARCA